MHVKRITAMVLTTILLNFKPGTVIGGGEGFHASGRVNFGAQNYKE
jgi:hypothetical protein